MKRKPVFEAEDGKQFDTTEACEKYEEEVFVNLLCGLDEIAVRAALNRTGIKLADAIERAGNIIAAKRRKSGELKRKRAGPGQVGTQRLRKSGKT